MLSVVIDIAFIFVTKGIPGLRGDSGDHGEKGKEVNTS